MSKFDVIIVGGGHAGVEAASAAARTGVTVALISFTEESIGMMSCNPAIGGLGKGHLVREVDALDGIIGIASDWSAIHYRMLNSSKGKAVQGPRVQADRKHFRSAVRALLARHPNLTVIAGDVTALSLKADRISGLILADGTQISGVAVVVATGTFLNARMFRGNERFEGGRVNERAATRLGEQILGLGFPMGRLKTGTPPRLDGKTIDWSRLLLQPSDQSSWSMSSMANRTLPQLTCAVTRTNQVTHDIVREAAAESPLFTGAIEGQGPRYCPSIEDKVVKFGDRDGHQIFLEPEGLETPLVYPNGLSTSLSPSTQVRLLQTICGLEHVAVVQPGYAVEYDYLDPRALDHRLAVRSINGLFTAGQINGTTGYEEAAAQGLIAGINAANYVRGEEPFLLDRASSYIGVMIDDLVLQGVTEPYRMLTARAEYRLQLRADNASTRLTDKGIEAGFIGSKRQLWWKQRKADIATARDFIDRPIGGHETVGDIVRRERWTVADFALSANGPHVLGKDVIEEVLEDVIYEPYIKRQIAEIRSVQASDGVLIPTSLDYNLMAGLSNEMKEKLTVARPETIGAAGRIRGISPAALAAILVACRHVTGR